jgi:hypothetical protein
MPVDMMARGALIAAMPTWWGRLWAKVKVIWTAMTSRRNHVITLSSDGKHIKLVDADKFSATEQVIGEFGPEAKGPEQKTEPRV